MALHLITFSYSQVVIRGTVVDSVSNDFLPYATIRMLQSKSDSLVQGTISNADGKYMIENINFGKYTLICSFIGFETKKIPIELKTKKNETLDIFLTPNSSILNEVIVKGFSVKYREQFNKTIVRPDSFDLKSSANAYDILKNVQGVQVDQLNGIVNLAGETNTLVLINNISVNRQKPLSSILPEDIERIEIINNPSSKYNSEYSGIINIILKKERNLGLRLNSNAGVLYNFALYDLSIEYSKDKYRLFATSENKYRFISYDKYEDRKYVIDDNSYSYNYKELNSNFQKLSNTFLLGTDYFFNPNNIVNITYRTDLFDYISKKERVTTSNFTSITNNQTTKSIYDGNEVMHNVSLYYKKIFRNSNKELLVDANYYLFNSKDISTYSHNILYEKLNTIFYTREDREEDQKHSFNLKLDYTEYINDNLSYEVGYNFYNRVFNNVFKTYSEENVFKLRENRNSLYSDFFWDFKKLSLWAGIRYEYSESIINSTNTVNKGVVLPNYGMSLQLSKGYKISINYKKYLTRPDIWQLNPFVYYTDSLNFSSGNPFLIPSSTNNIELKHTFFKKNKQVSMILYSNWSKDIIDNVFIIGQNSSTYETCKNITENNTFGTKISFAFSYRKWKFSAFFNGYYDEFTYIDKTSKGFGYDFNLTSSVDLPKSFFAGFHMYSPGGKKITSQGYIIAKQKISQIYFGKSIIKDKGKLYVILFNLPSDKTITNTSALNYNSTQKMEVSSLSAGIYFTYFFNKGKETKRLKRQYNMEQNSKAKH
jgi:hypothetical protein